MAYVTSSAEDLEVGLVWPKENQDFLGLAGAPPFAAADVRAGAVGLLPCHQGA